jgi:hypothetical protein
MLNIIKFILKCLATILAFIMLILELAIWCLLTRSYLESGSTANAVRVFEDIWD